jgi:two-component system sensor histidine kinase/response regulator
MLRSVLAQIYLLITRVANNGVYTGLDFHERKKIQIVNITVTAGLFPNLVFGPLNFLQGRQLLALVNAALFFGGLLILWMHHKRKYPLARLLLSVAASVAFSIGAIFYRNGGEYFLLANLIVIVVFFNEAWFLILMSIVNCGMFIAIKVFLQSGIVYGTVPFGRILFNISWTLVMMVLGLWFFKNEQIGYQTQVEEKNRELERINKGKEKIFSIIAHDLRSPIAQLKSSLALVNREYISAEQFHQITSGLALQVDQLHTTLDNLLRWSLSQLQGITAKPERVALAPVIAHKLELYQQRIEEKQLKLRVENIDHRAWVDRDHLLLVLRNLLSNAIKYSYPGGTIIVQCFSSDREVTIAVADAGPGMSKGKLASLFREELVSSEPGTAQEKGTGLGLKLCREFIEKNNGRISAESFENKGSTFYLSLPKAPDIG